MDEKQKINEAEQLEQELEALYQKESEELHDVVCSMCGKVFKVSFKPDEGRTVICTRCYLMRRGGSIMDERHAKVKKPKRK